MVAEPGRLFLTPRSGGSDGEALSEPDPDIPGSEFILIPGTIEFQRAAERWARLLKRYWILRTHQVWFAISGWKPRRANREARENLERVLGKPDL